MSAGEFIPPFPASPSSTSAGAIARGTPTLNRTRARLAGYKRPKYVVLADSLPENPSGKILKRDLRKDYAQLADND